MDNNRQISHGERYEIAKVKAKINKKKLLYFLSSIYIIGFVAIVVLWMLGV